MSIKSIRSENMQVLEIYNATKSASRNALMSTVKTMYEKGTIRTLNQAERLLKLLQDNEMDKFDKSFGGVEISKNKALAKQQAKEIAKPQEFTERNSKRHIMRIKNKSSELPTFELEFKKEYKVFEVAWKDGVQRLIKAAQSKLAEKQNLKIVVGVEIIISKPGSGDNDPDTKTIHAHTMPESVYSEEGVGPLIKNKKNDLQKRMQDRIEHQAGSGWTIERIKGLFLTTYTQTPSRGSSYIPTPQTLSNSKCGLINITNNDNLCFKYCMLYHQSDKGKHGERLSVVKKVVDKYDWSNIGFPTSFEDITTFEHNNKVCVNIYGHSNEREINPIRLGALSYVKNDNINLLLLKDEEDNGHYVYIKKSRICYTPSKLVGTKTESIAHTAGKQSQRMRSTKIM